MREIVRMIFVLCTICGISGFVLSYLKAMTEPIIQLQVLTYLQGPAIQKVYTAATNDPIAERHVFTSTDGTNVTVFPYKVDGALMGVAIEGTGQGYGGDIGVMTGFDVHKDTLLGIGITQMSETPGLGTHIGDVKFTRQFTGKPLEVKLKNQGGAIDAVAGATVSSVGALQAIGNASKLYQELKPHIQKQWQ